MRRRPSRTKIVYLLRDPRDHAPRRDGNIRKVRWIRGLLAKGLMYEIEILSTVSDHDALVRAEIEWIARGRAEGWSLLNLTDGGEGAVGIAVSAETRARMSAAQRARTDPGTLGYIPSAETRALW